MTGRVLALIFIYVCTCIGWAILGGSVWQRTRDSRDSLGQNVASIWGSPQRQSPPQASYKRTVEVPRSENFAARPGEKSAITQVETVDIPIASSRIDAKLDLEHRRKGLLWFSTYAVDFAGRYVFVNPTDAEQAVTIQFALPHGQAVYDGFTATVNGQPVDAPVTDSVLTLPATIAPGGRIEFATSYRSQGMDSWTYELARGASRVNDFVLTMKTNFDRIDFPESGLAPTSRKEIDNGWEVRWEYGSLLSGLSITMAMPAKLQPGELVERITFFAPVSLMFFFFLLFILTVMKNVDIHPMNYFFLAAAFFAFHLLLAYTADHIDIHVAFLLSSAVSIFLVVSYLRVVVGMRFALLEAGVLQFLYLVGFSYTFFLEGYSALCVTIASIITLFIVMQLTARIRWGEFFLKAKQQTAPPPPPPEMGNRSFVPMS